MNAGRLPRRFRNSEFRIPNSEFQIPLYTVPMAKTPKPALLTSFLLRPAMHRTQRCFLASGCSTYCQVRLRAPQVDNPAGHGTSPTSQQKLVRSAG